MLFQISNRFFQLVQNYLYLLAFICSIIKIFHEKNKQKKNIISHQLFETVYVFLSDFIAAQ